ncbi:MAG: MBL fold metallo-hydrolase [Candidatus Kerfeldbacteria bacterium]|nr:MBL fold metallo-hydrolase [Candidatus Kerfeldbacteria bacterium]
MTITKFLHSCIELELEGYHLLIDPGNYCFIEGKLKPEDIPQPDNILITHSHADHMDTDALKVLCKQNTLLPYGHKVAVEMLQKAGIQGRTAKNGDELKLGPFQVDVLEGTHAKLPSPVPPNVGYLINDSVFHPGDSFAYDIDYVDVLLLPIAGPWLNINESLAFALAIKPKLVIPIHDGMMKGFALKSLYENHCGPTLAAEGIGFQRLGMRESIEI